MSLLLLWLGLSAAVWSITLLGVLGWGRSSRLSEGTSEAGVQVCVPARNEARNIDACVRSVLASSHEQLTFVVADDQSTDATATLALRAADGHPAFTLRAVPDRPQGWSGKAWACTLAAKSATAPYLLFLDADVRVSPSFIARMVGVAEREQVDLVSALGTWDVRGLGETVVVPTIGWLIRGAADPDAVNRGERAFANGQALLVRRSAYLAIGGHSAVKGTVLDDVRLAEAMMESGAKVRLYWAPGGFTVRLYDGVREVFEGYRKNLFEGLGRSRVLAVVGAVSLLAFGVLPILGPWLAWGQPVASVLAWVTIAAMVGTRVRLERLDGRSGLVAPLHPVGLAFLVAVLAASALSREVSWKGRTFTGGSASS